MLAFCLTIACGCLKFSLISYKTQGKMLIKYSLSNNFPVVLTFIFSHLYTYHEESVVPPFHAS